MITEMNAPEKSPNLSLQRWNIEMQFTKNAFIADLNFSRMFQSNKSIDQTKSVDAFKLHI